MKLDTLETNKTFSFLLVDRIQYKKWTFCHPEAKFKNSCQMVKKVGDLFYYITLLYVL